MTDTRIETESVAKTTGPRPGPRALPRFTGTMTTWDDERGFGFIAVDNGSTRLFVHISAFPANSVRPTVGSILNFEIERTEQGRHRAIRVTGLPEAEAGQIHVPTVATGGLRDRQVVVSSAVFGGFLAVFAILEQHWHVSTWVFALYAVASLSAFIGYYMDKRAAQARQWRVREGTLLALGLLGGWPGALLAQQVLRHKTRKVAFRRAFWGTVALNIAALIAFTSPSWTALLRAANYR
jgi:uncharacterized membrane protein YsdA (DUF1294 family)/cold shock CspA family protein